MTYLVQQKPFRDPLSIFEDFFDNSSRRSIALIDLQEDADHIYVTVEAPGVPKSEIRVEYQERRLRISGERKALNSHVSAGSLHREIS
ncbi:MAG: HSP20 family molecular chaperone IbpA, partial [Candidatus Marinamargulisbacteria bacterium]